MTITNKFSPLSGYYISKHSLEKVERESHDKVLVPFRGNTFLNCPDHHSGQWDRSVLVPFRGNTFLNVETRVIEHSGRFSSPFGGIHFLTLSPETRYISGLPDRFAAQKQIVPNFMFLSGLKCQKTQYLSHAGQKLQIEPLF